MFARRRVAMFLPAMGLLRVAHWTAVIAMTLAAFSAAAQSSKINVDESNVAINGYDTVAYFTLGKPTKGDAQYEIVWDDVRWRFANAEHREMFLREPERYAPRFGGFCALGMSRGFLSIVDPEAWRIVNGRLFLAYNKKDLETFGGDLDSTIEKAERSWRRLGPR